MSGQPCGCDPECNDHKCEQHRAKCAIPPPGWRCTREPNHEGPCAAMPDPDDHRPRELTAPVQEDSEARRNLEEAWRLTHGNRKASYGDVRNAFARYAKIWTGLLGPKLAQELTASDVALLMTGLKLAREMNKQQSDNVTDAHGYLILHDEIKAAQ